MNSEILGQVFTKKTVANYMVSLLTLKHDERILDPCFGKGVFLESLKENGFSNLLGCEIDTELFKTFNDSNSDLILYNTDFLKFSRDDVDGIVMNPPYIRHERIEELAKYGITKEFLKQSRIFDALPKNANMYMYFIIKGLSVLRNNGEMVVIFPSSWLNTKSGLSFKKILYSNYDVVEQDHIKGDAFEENALVDVLILKIIKRKPSDGLSKKYLIVSNSNILFAPKSENKLNVGFNYSFSDYYSIRRGITTGFNDMFINPSKEYNLSDYLCSIISSPKDVIGYSTKNALLDDIVMINKDDVINEELSNYLSFYRNQILSLKVPKTFYNKILVDDKWYCLSSFDCKGYIFSYFVRNDMKFVIHNSDSLIRDNFYIIKPINDSLFYFSLLNNYYTFYQLEMIGKMYGSGLLKIQKYDFESIVFPDVNSFDNKDINELTKLSNMLIKTNDEDIIEKITKIISKYSSISYDKIVEEYKSVKTKRLEERT